MSRRRAGAAAMISVPLVLAGCTAGPDYRRPDAAVPDSYKEAPAAAAPGWKLAAPADGVPRGAWWTIYGDPVLDDLARQVRISNQNLRAAEAAYRQARAVAAEARAGLFPILAANASVTRSGSGQGVASSTGFSRGHRAATSYGISADASWEPDLWGRIRRTVESDVASAEASAADLASAQLSAEAELVADYFQLRAADEQKRLLDEAAAAYARSLEITRNQYAAGIVPSSDVSQAETQLKTTQAQAIAVGITRAQLEHAIAVLIGKPPAALTIRSATLPASVPEVPPGLPSALLERRPDIAAAERRVAAANATIGVAEAAFYPTVTLSASYGYSALALGSLLQAPNSLWSFGAALAQTIFDAGARSARVEQARAAHEQSVANYRQTTLTAFQAVEDQLAALRILAEQAVVQADAVRAANEAERVALNQYRAGLVAYTAVVQTQTAALGSREAALTIRQNRLVASVNLVKALGGGWTTAELAADERKAATPGR